MSKDESVRLAYEARRTAVLDEQSALKRAESLGIEKGLRQGFDSGKAEVAEKMIARGFDDELVMNLTGLDLRKIQELRKQ